MDGGNISNDDLKAASENIIGKIMKVEKRKVEFPKPQSTTDAEDSYKEAIDEINKTGDEIQLLHMPNTEDQSYIYDFKELAINETIVSNMPVIDFRNKAPMNHNNVVDNRSHRQLSLEVPKMQDELFNDGYKSSRASRPSSDSTIPHYKPLNRLSKFHENPDLNVSLKQISRVNLDNKINKGSVNRVKNLFENDKDALHQNSYEKQISLKSERENNMRKSFTNKEFHPGSLHLNRSNSDTASPSTETSNLQLPDILSNNPDDNKQLSEESADDIMLRKSVEKLRTTSNDIRKLINDVKRRSNFESSIVNENECRPLSVFKTPASPIDDPPPTIHSTKDKVPSPNSSTFYPKVPPKPKQSMKILSSISNDATITRAYEVHPNQSVPTAKPIEQQTTDLTKKFDSPYYIKQTMAALDKTSMDLDKISQRAIRSSSESEDVFLSDDRNNTQWSFPTPKPRHQQTENPIQIDKYLPDDQSPSAPQPPPRYPRTKYSNHSIKQLPIHSNDLTRINNMIDTSPKPKPRDSQALTVSNPSSSSFLISSDQSSFAPIPPIRNPNKILKFIPAVEDMNLVQTTEENMSDSSKMSLQNIVTEDAYNGSDSNIPSLPSSSPPKMDRRFAPQPPIRKRWIDSTDQDNMSREIGNSALDSLEIYKKTASPSDEAIPIEDMPNSNPIIDVLDVKPRPTVVNPVEQSITLSNTPKEEFVPKINITSDEVKSDERSGEPEENDDKSEENDDKSKEAKDNISVDSNVDSHSKNRTLSPPKVTRSNSFLGPMSPQPYNNSSDQSLFPSNGKFTSIAKKYGYL